MHTTFIKSENIYIISVENYIMVSIQFSAKWKDFKIIKICGLICLNVCTTAVWSNFFREFGDKSQPPIIPETLPETLSSEAAVGQKPIEDEDDGDEIIDTEGEKINEVPGMNNLQVRMVSTSFFSFIVQC